MSMKTICGQSRFDPNMLLDEYIEDNPTEKEIIDSIKKVSGYISFTL